MENKTEKKTIRAPLFIIAAMLESAAIAADPNAKREILKAVNLTSDAAGEKLTATATDSARLNRVTYDLALDAENNNKEIKASANFSINLAPSSVNKIISLNKEAEKESKKGYSKYFILANIETDGNAATITTENANGETVASAKLETICETYPVTENIFPANKGAFLSFSPSFIGDLKKASKALKGNGDAVTMQAPAAPFRPFVCEYQSGIPQLEAVALVTPFRRNGGNYPGFDYLTSGGAAVTEYKNKIQLLESRLSHMEEERNSLSAELQKALRTEDKPAAVPGDVVTLETVKKAHSETLANLTKTTQEKEEAERRAADLEEKYKAAAATIHEKNAENIKLLNKIKELEKQLQEAQTTTAAAALIEKKDGGNEPATDRQRAYIAKLGGTLPDGATIRDASILITQLKKSRVYSAA